MSRPYRMSQRAEAIEDTRRRIVDAAVELHDELGPARTSIKAIAERAGVQRLTVYRHFPDDMALLTACSSKWAEDNPRPDPGEWQHLSDPTSRLRAALTAFYGYYGRNERMLANLLRDESEVPFVSVSMGALRAYLTDIRDGLMTGRRARGRRKRQLEVLIRHALAPETWLSLSSQGLDPEKASDLMVVAIEGVAQS